MRLLALTLYFVFIVLVAVATGQTKPADSDPVIRGPATYSMPQSAIDAEIDGRVVVGIRVDETGKPTTAVLVSGPVWPCGERPLKAFEDLESTLADMMMKLRFTPAVKDGKPIAKNVGLQLDLKNPKLAPVVEIDAATGKPKPRRVGGGVLNGKAKYLERPAYPAAARANRDRGTVSVSVLIDEKGKVVRAGAVSGTTTLQYAARDAACGSKFEPTTFNGNPVKVSGVITYNFVP